MSSGVFVLGVCMALVALGFVLTDALLREPRVSEMNCRRLREGMAFRDVVAILGEHPLKDKADPTGKALIQLAWSADEGTADVLFVDGKVAKFAWFATNSKSRPLDRLRARLGW